MQFFIAIAGVMEYIRIAICTYILSNLAMLWSCSYADRDVDAKFVIRI